MSCELVYKRVREREEAVVCLPSSHSPQSWLSNGHGRTRDPGREVRGPGGLLPLDTPDRAGWAHI